MHEYPSQACPQVQSTLAKLTLCRSEALGERWYGCSKCKSLTKVYNSCGDRHCPGCSGSKRQQWVEKAEQLLLEGVDYYQVVFTLPKALSRLALGNRRQLYSLLFRASWQAIQQTLEQEQGYEAAAAMVLHTWNQQLEAHGHVHAVVPGGGPSLHSPGTWKRTEYRGQPTSKYLADESQLRRNYRDAFIEGLERLHTRGELKLEGEFAELREEECWRACIDKLKSTKWVVYIEPPPHEGCRPEHVVRYLGRYLTGGPISDRRLISASEQHVSFWAREGSQAGGSGQRIPVELTPVEFVRRWSLHILPKGFVKTRRYGGWSNKHRQRYLQQCQRLLNSGEVQVGELLDELAEADEMQVATESSPNCPHCGGVMKQLRSEFRPSWKEMRSRGQWPWWYLDRSLVNNTS